MPDDCKPGRIRWERGPNLWIGSTGHVGTVAAVLFRLHNPERPGWAHMLTTDLPGMAKPFHGTEDEVKAKAEEWLGEFAASLGAVFPDAAPKPEGGWWRSSGSVTRNEEEAGDAAV